MKDISLSVDNNGVRIIFKVTKSKNTDSILNCTDKMVQDALRKASIVYALHTGFPLDIQMLMLSINGGTPVIRMPLNNEPPIIFSMLNRICFPIGNNWNTFSTFDTICSVPKTRQDSRFSALYALLLSKTKTYAIERFIYLWMAMNGLYGFAASAASVWLPLTKKGKPKRPQECDEQRLLANILGIRFHSFLSSETEKGLFHKGERLFSECTPIVSEYTGHNNLLEKEISDLLSPCMEFRAFNENFAKKLH